MMMKAYLVLLLACLNLIQAGEVEIGHLVIQESVLQPKERFIFSDFGSNPKVKLANASIDFQVSIHQENYHNLNPKNAHGPNFIRYYVIVCNHKQQALLQENINRNEVALKDAKLPFSFLFKPFKSDYIYYHQGLIDDMMANNQQYPIWLNETVPVAMEGVYYTNFMYELINTTIAENEHKLIRNNTDPTNLSPLFNYALPEVDDKRILKQYKVDEIVELNKYVKNLQKNLVPERWKNNYKTQRRLVVQGNITFSNSHGSQLSADLYPNISISALFVLAYSVLELTWGCMLRQSKGKQIRLQRFIEVLICATWFEQVLTLIYYLLRDKSKSDLGHLYAAIMLIEIWRLVFSRIITLLVALGLDIVITSVQKYCGKIMVITVLQALALSASIAIEHTKHEHSISFAIVGIVQGVVLILDVLLIFWILLAFKRTIKYLSTSNEGKEVSARDIALKTYKKQIVTQIYKVFSMCVILEFGLEISDLFTLRSSKNIDDYWKSSAMWERNNFVIYTVFLICMMWYLKPTDESYKLEEEMEELLNETLQTEMAEEKAAKAMDDKKTEEEEEPVEKKEYKQPQMINANYDSNTPLSSQQDKKENQA